jgi:phage-related protein (TIGR01555 family)
MVNTEKVDELRRYAHLIEKQAGRAVRPYRADGYVNMMTKYGTKRDQSEHYQFKPEPAVPDEVLMNYYEGNGLFAKIIDTPADEAIKNGFELEGITDKETETFYREALDELDWDNIAATALKWARLFGGAIAVMLINDGRGLDEPLDWNHIKSIDDIRIYDRSIVQPDYTSMFSYEPDDPFRTRGSRLGMPEYYTVFSRYGTFRVHDSRCLVFQNGVLPENTSNTEYQIWGIPEYIRIQRAIRDSEIAHGSAVKLLDRSVQAIYKMSNLSSELATEGGEDRVLKRLETIDMARGMLNTITVDRDGEDYDFKSFSYAGVADVVETTCNYLSALTSIPQTVLFGRDPTGMNATGKSDLENYYNFVERIQKRVLKPNLRYLLSVVFEAGLSTGEIKKVPPIKVKFNPLWSMSAQEEADIAASKTNIQSTRAGIAKTYIELKVISPTEVRKALASGEEFDVETMLDGYTPEELEANAPAQDDSGGMPQEEPTENEQSANGMAPASVPDATKLPEDMNVPIDGPTDAQDALKGNEGTDEPKKAKDAQESERRHIDAELSRNVLAKARKDSNGSCGVLIIKDGKVLTGVRLNDYGRGLICGPGGHIEDGETARDAAIRETQEEFGITPTELIELGTGPEEPDSKLQPVIFLCTKYEGEPKADCDEMARATFMTMDEIKQLDASLFQPFKDSLEVLDKAIFEPEREERMLTPEELTEAFNARSINDEIYKPQKHVDRVNGKCYSIGMDGAPIGNQNAAGPHNMSGGPKVKGFTKEQRAGILKELKGFTTNTGLQIKDVTDHAYQRMDERRISTKTIRHVLTKGVADVSRKRANCLTYTTNDRRVVVDKDNGKIVSVMRRLKNWEEE